MKKVGEKYLNKNYDIYIEWNDEKKCIVLN